MPTKCEMFAYSPQTWWLLNLFLVSFDKLPCLQRDIPLTQPLVIVYTSSHQSRRALSGFDSNIHFASEVPYRKWLDRSSLFLQLLTPSSPTVFPLTLTSLGTADVTGRLKHFTNTSPVVFARACVALWIYFLKMSPFLFLFCLVFFLFGTCLNVTKAWWCSSKSE